MAEAEPSVLSSIDGVNASREDARFVARTIHVWKEHYGVKLSETEAKGIARNLSRFFDILAEWDRHTDQADPLRDPYQRNGGHA